MNLCSKKWNLDKFKDKTVAEILKNGLVENGLTCRYLGDTFTSDIIQKNGKIATSALDPVYLTEMLNMLVLLSSILILYYFFANCLALSLIILLVCSN